MKKVCLIITAMFIFCIAQNADAQKPLLVINGENISSDEFMSVYMKNNTSKSATKSEIDEYLELYINFRLKVAEAKALQLDTFSTFKTELEGYRKTLAQPYLTKTEILDKLVAEAYDRMQWDLRASHILIKVSPYASPADTLAAYKKALGLRNRAQKGEPFEKLAVEFSDDESAKGREGSQAMKGNSGDLGYFSGMDLVYEFENVAYNMKVGEISMPVRTEFGYHIIKLTDRKPALGKVQTAHILIAIPADADAVQTDEARQKVFGLYDRIVAGESYEEIAKEYSDDKGSGMRGGVLPWFGVFRMLPEFIEPLYSIPKGGVSKPVLTSYGYHIIRLIDVKPVGSFDDMKNELKTRVMRDNRYKTATKSFIASLKKDNGFEEYPASLTKFIAGVSDDLYENSWTADTFTGEDLPLFKTGDRVYRSNDFAAYLEFYQLLKEGDEKEMYIRGLYDKFVDDMVLAYENDHLEQKHPAFASLMKEYHDGILLFDLTDQMVWSKALRDTTGLKLFYETIRNNYMWPRRVEGTVFYINDQATANKFFKALKKASKKGIENEKIIAPFNTADNVVITKESGIYILEEHPVFSGVKTAGIMPPYMNNEGKYLVVKTDRIISPEPKALNEVRGVVTNEYQNHLEKEWIRQLRSKYEWKVNEDVLKTLYH